VATETNRPEVDHFTPPQKSAVAPDANVWLSASAGSGKTQVLSGRVIRLLLAGAKPEEILCLTFTKAAAAEMAERINRRLAKWVMMPDEELFWELEAIGAPSKPVDRDTARRLFAEILDAPGSGLQIMTIHSFCQSLLASFPEEADIMPGFEPLDERTKAELQKEVLAQIAQEADQDEQGYILESLRQLSMERGEDGAWSFLQRCAASSETMRALPEGSGLLAFVRRQLGLGIEGSTDDLVATLVCDESIDIVSIRAVVELNLEWGKDRGLQRAAKINQWLEMDPLARGLAVDLLHGCWTKGDGEPMVSSKGFTPNSDEYASIALDLHLWTKALCEKIALARYADRLANALFAGKAFAARYETVKRARGLVDFDDLINKAEKLLTTSGMTDWVRYKLDQRIDHILVDEAQDTNARQWAIIESLSGDFVAGEGAKGAELRTIFAVGDFKQAIYGFQGTDPDRYREAGERYGDRLAEQECELNQLTLSRSFRSTQPVLALVNAVINTLGHSRFGLMDYIEDHISEKPDIGMIELIEPVMSAASEDKGEGDNDEEKWLGPEKRELAAILARRIKALVDERPVLSSGKPLTPGDIMVLFRKRTEVASLLVARLHALDVPVSGIDRMQIGEQLAVQDLVSAIRFALQPQDDLSLACLLVSPLIGWTQQQLLEEGYRSEKIPLWQHVRRDEKRAADLAPLQSILASADFTTPYQFLEQILSGPTRGREKFVARLGEQVLVPIEEFLNFAIEFEQSRGGTLQQFLDWFERNPGEIKRERLAGSNEVQIMTVHGAKGLQAPVVILADVTVDPEARGNRDPGSSLPIGDGLSLPLLRIDKDLRIGPLAEIEEEREARELNEHYRLLYVALTRAEERLIMAGSLGSRQDTPKPHSWYCAVEGAMDAMGAVMIEDASGCRSRIYRGTSDNGTAPSALTSKPTASKAALPKWLLQEASPEAQPPRPLAPSQLDDSDAGEKPAIAAMQLAAERGKLVHGLIERLDPARKQSFEQDALKWLALRDKAARHDHGQIIAQLRSMIDDPRWAPLFSIDARAEVPIAALVGRTVVSGRIDRLLIAADEVSIVDFKTSRRVPRTISDVPLSELRQMAHYVAAVERIFPGKNVSAALLYTHAPAMISLSQSELAPHRPV
jgi:ATP-dependent helicase/nuclease subunit A